MAEDGHLVETVARVLAKQMFSDATEISVEEAWAPQRDDVKRGLRLKAIEILKHVDNAVAVGPEQRGVSA
jgi:hypothetical protein